MTTVNIYQQSGMMELGDGINFMRENRSIIGSENDPNNIILSNIGIII